MPDRHAHQGSTAGAALLPFAPWQPVIYDLSLVAAAINFCDWNCKRPSNIWERRFEVRIPVHEPARWNDPPVRTALQRVLQTLTGDRWDLTFIDRQSPYPSPSDQSLALPSKTQAVIAFSNGLDSYSVGNWYAAEHGDETIVRVHVGRGYKAQPRRVPFTALPFKVKALPKIRHETSQRARGFKFAAASGLAASLANVSDIIVPESGSGALGPVLVRYSGMYSGLPQSPEVLPADGGVPVRAAGAAVEFQTAAPRNDERRELARLSRPYAGES
ncbi:MAG: hypothetical protein IPL62_17500 [Caulobacteraceae bacterium]|nr:hypothetical protein [Caulobacteraceae bacterium]